MARQASDLTVATRELFDKTEGKITHSEARPLLQKQGFELAEDPSQKSEELSQLESDYEVASATDDEVSAACRKAGFSAAATSRVLKEVAVRRDFAAEANKFNVTKNLWRKAKESGKPTVSRKPKVEVAPKRKPGRLAKVEVALKRKPGRPAKVEVSPKKLGRPVSRGYEPTAAELEALRVVEGAGGVALVQKQIKELEEALELVAQLKERVSQFESRLKDAA